MGGVREGWGWSAGPSAGKKEFVLPTDLSIGQFFVFGYVYIYSNQTGSVRVAESFIHFPAKTKFA